MEEGNFRSGRFEFLGATSIVVLQPGVLEVYQILIENPGAPPVHTASFRLPRLNFGRYSPTLQITGSPPLSQRIDHGNPSDCSPFPFPSFPLAEENHYLTIRWGPYRSSISTSRSELQCHVPLSFLRRSPLYGDALAIPWKTWSKGVYFHNSLEGDCRVSGGRLVCFTMHCRVTASHLNGPRAGRLGVTSADPGTDHAQLHAIKPGLWATKMTMDRPHPVHLASRSLSLDIHRPLMVCDDEHVVFRGAYVRYLFVPPW
jgi:hypothetical protein